MPIMQTIDRVAGTVRSVCGATVLLVLFSSGVAGQTVTKSATDQMTPANLAAGTPAGSYALSGFDNVSLFNGNLNFRLPLLAIGGRGSSGYTMMLALNTKSWHVKRTSFLVNGEETNITYTPTRNAWQGYDVGYGPGTLIGRRSGEGTKQPVIPPCTTQHPIYEKTMTRLTFTGSDGTEFEFVDQLTMGKPYTTQQLDCGQVDGFSRGRVFVTTKGEAATFISDVEIRDKNPVALGVSIYVNATGYMLLRDGTRYRIENALVTWLQDRNGNRTTFSYDGNHRVSRVTDSLNRQVNITYDNSAATDCSAHFDEITFTGFGGTPRSIKIWHQCLSSTLRSDQTIKTYTQLFPELNGSGNITPNQFDKRVVSAVTLPDGRQYQFFYNSYAEVARVVLPTGGAYEYDYTATSGVGDDNVTGVDKEIYRRVIERRVMPDGTNVEGLTRYSPATGVGVGPVKADHFDGSGTLRLAHEEHTFHTSGAPLQDGLQPFVILYPDVLDGMEDDVDAMDTNGTTALRQELNTYVVDPAPWTDNGFQWSINGRQTDTLTKLLDVSPALVSKRHLDYDQYNNPTSVKEYDFGSNGQRGALARQTTTTYVVTNGGVNYATVNPNTTNPDASATVHLRSLPLQQSVFDGPTGVEKARTTYEYDSYTQGLTDRSDISAHARTLDNPPSYTSSYITRGNATQITRWVLGSPNVGLSTRMQYDIAGNVLSATDPKGNTTTFEFNDRYGSPNDEAESNTAPPELTTPPRTSYAFATKVTSAAPFNNQIAYTQYDYYLGEPVNIEDANTLVSSARYGGFADGSYTDLLDRPTEIIAAANVSSLSRRTRFTYSDSSHLITTQKDQTTFNDGVLTGAVLYDGLGRTTETHTSAPEGTIYSKQQYDAMGRLKRSYNPYRTSGDETYGYADTVYDALSRVTTVTTSDNAVVSTTYSGDLTTVRDQANKQRRSSTDGLGRLTTLDEMLEYPSATVYATTTYGYDVLDDLTGVTQTQQSPAVTQNRTFVYDSLKRLTDATNPESGHVTYTYDANSNLATRLDARPITTNYFYDALNRVTKRTYSGATPEVHYYYDNQTLPATKPPNFSPTNSIGRLIATCYGGATSSAGSYQGYDQLGQVTSSYQQTDSQNYGFSYTYNLAGEMTSETYPSGRQVSTEYDSAGRVAGVRSAAFYYAGAQASDATNRIQYAPQGAVSIIKLGNGKWEHAKFNVRLQPTQIGLGTSGTNSSILALDYGYGITRNNGNVMSQTITIGSTVMSQSYGYDALNRLQGADENSGANWSQSYGYDRFGNRWVSGSTGYTLSSLTPTGSGAFNAANNRLNASGYDAAGNQTSDAQSRTFEYDGENRQTRFNVTAGQYFYDGDGRRVKKIDGGGTTIFVYNVEGQLIAEYTSGAPSGGGTSYLTSDHLGSTRVVTKSDGTVKARYDYLPFGEELGAGIGQRTTGMGYSAV